MVDEQTATVGPDENQNQVGQEPEDRQDKQEPEVLKMTKEEYDKTLKSETDRRVEEAVKTHRAKWEKEYKKKVEEERRDAERLAQLSAEEREKEMLGRQKEELTSKEKLLRQRELKLTAIDILSDEKLPVSFADQLLGEDADETYGRIQKFKQAWHDAVEEEVNKRLKGKIPREGSTEKKPPDMNTILRSMARR